MADTAPILMPLEQEGTKSTVRAWLKKIGDPVKRDETIVEIETDKVAVEIPAPEDGVLGAIMLDVGAEAPPGATLGAISLVSSVISDAQSPTRSSGYLRSDVSPLAAATKVRSPNEGRELRLSPLVRRLLAEHELSPNEIVGSGRDGRITHRDVEEYIKHGPASAAKAAPAPGRLKAARIPHDAMRRAIAEHMTRSVAVAPHVTAVFEADFSAVMAHRGKHKAAYERDGAPLTYSAFIVAAAAAAMQAAPNVNARWHDDALEVFEDVNIGMGVALGEKGLIVPVIQRAQTLTLKQIAAALSDLTERARKNALAPADVQNGTFTISNHGVSGSLLAAPIIINQPQSAILGVGKLEKRVIVREIDGADTIQIRPMAYVSLTIDHRVLDGHQTNAWLTRFVETLEAWPQEA